MPADGGVVAHAEHGGVGQESAGKSDGDPGDAVARILGREVGHGLDEVPGHDRVFGGADAGVDVGGGVLHGF